LNLLLLLLLSSSSLLLSSSSLTAIGLPPGGSSATLVQTKIKIHKTTEQLKQQNNYKTQNNKITTK
jgi:hypothetical protein